MYKTIAEAVFASGEKNPSKEAVIFKDQVLTYGELCRRIVQFSALLQTEYGITKHDKVMLSAISKPEYIVAWLSVNYIGATAVLIDKTALAETIADLYSFMKPKLLVTNTKLNDSNINYVLYSDIYDRECCTEGEGPAFGQPDENDVAEILFTTGTTGRPKGVMLTFGNIYAITHNTRNGVSMQSDDRVLVPLPLNHSVGMRESRAALYIGATLVLQNGFMFSKETKENIVKNKCTALVSVPASIELLYRNLGENFVPVMKDLRYIEVGAGSLNIHMKKLLPELLPETNIYNTWGSTETGGVIFLNVSKERDKIASLGRISRGTALKIVDGGDNEVTGSARDIDTAGRMALKGDMQMLGYFERPEETQKAIVNGWLYTNDLIYLDDDGYVYMVGRADDIINVGGEKVSPTEVENAATEYEGILDAGVIGAADPDGVLGQIVVLYIVENTGYDRKEFVRFLSRKLERYKLPADIISVPEIPRNKMKKLDRKTLKSMYENRQSVVTNEVIQTILNRKSIRHFKDTEVSEDILKCLIEAAKKAPSGHNMQTWHFSVINNDERIQQLKKTAEKVAAENNEKIFGFFNPKVLIVISSDRRNSNGVSDCACAAENIMIAAASLGLGSVWLNCFRKLCDYAEMRESLTEIGIPERHAVWSTIALGYSDEDPKAVARKDNVVTWIN